MLAESGLVSWESPLELVGSGSATMGFSTEEFVGVEFPPPAFDS